MTASPRGAGAGQLPRFDPGILAGLDDPYPTYARLRSTAPLFRAGPAQYAVTRYADAVAVLRDPRLGHQLPDEYHRFVLGDGPARYFLQRIILHRDSTDHTRLRQLMGAAFSPGSVRALAARIGDLVDGLLAGIADARAVEVVGQLAFPLPALVICDLLGVPADERDLVRPHAIALAKAFGASIGPAEREAGDAAVAWLRDYLGDLLEQRRKRPGDDLLSRLMQATEGGDRLRYDEIVDNAVFLFFAGFETTTSLLSTGCAALLAHPDQAARLRADRALMPTAIEEFLRYDSPVQVTARLALEPVEVCGQRLRPGRIVLVLLGSCNHDERQFTDAEGLDVGRQPNGHLSFGGGPHYCLGAALARLEGSVAFGKLLSAFPEWAPGGPVEHQVGASFRSYARVPIAVTPG
jgi:cytochrome P450